MPDLSEMLGAVYGAPDETDPIDGPPPAPATGPKAPEWADDEHLDKAFAEWTPGPDADAPAAERNMFAPAPAAATPRLADDLAAALSEAVLAENRDDDAEDDHEQPAAPAMAAPPALPALPVDDEPAPAAEAPLASTILAELEPQPEPEPEPEPPAMPVHKAGWQRADDDIIPSGRSSRASISIPRPGRGPRKPKAAKDPKALEALTAGAVEAAPEKKRERKGLKGLAKMEISLGKKK